MRLAIQRRWIDGSGSRRVVVTAGWLSTFCPPRIENMALPGPALALRVSHPAPPKGGCRSTRWRVWSPRLTQEGATMTPLYRAAGSAALFFALATHAMAQVTSGTILGAVTDSSGGVLPGVTVAATNLETGLV